ncbi:PEP-CTERM sorting domain-containing protein [Pontiellaceae bacterium B1224]|nr:PEP-CTERM sorting domain-containing protein [Pontiellaceae bacterium B1224]
MKKRTTIVASFVALALPFVSSAALIIDSQGSGTLETDPFPGTFTPISATDLANSDQATFLSASDIDTGGRGDTTSRLFDGVAGVGVGFEAQFNTGSITINLDTSVNTLGYNISGINTYAAWNTGSGGRSDQEYTLTFIYMDDSFEEITNGTHYANTVAAADENGEVNVWTEVKISDDAGMIGTGVKSVKFDFLTGANAGGTATYTEFDIVGVAVPEPATLGLITACGGGILFIRRRFMI